MMSLNEIKVFVEKAVTDLIDICPHCGAKTHIEKLWDGPHSYRNGDIEYYIVFRCKPCKKLLLKTYKFRENQFTSDQYISEGWQEKYPSLLEKDFSKDDAENIPKHVYSDYIEAIKCKSVGANKASCAMFRRALQSALIELGADAKTDLINQIDSVSSISNEIKDWGHQIRIFGNWGSHPDQDRLKEVDVDDVIEVHDFISKLFIYVFIMPKKVQSSRLKRQEKLDKDNK